MSVRRPRRLHPRNLRLARRVLADAEPCLAPIIAAAGPVRIRPAANPDPFAALCRSIIYQQLSGHSAGSIHRRFLDLFGAGPPNPVALKRHREPELRAVGLSAAKTRALIDLAEHYLDGCLPVGTALNGLDDESIVSRFTAVRGIGRWTVEMMLIFELGRPDVLPLNDLGVRRGWSRLRKLDALPDAAELAADGERWRPWRSVAAWYLWRAAEAPA